MKRTPMFKLELLVRLLFSERLLRVVRYGVDVGDDFSVCFALAYDNCKRLAKPISRNKAFVTLYERPGLMAAPTLQPFDS